MITTDIIGFSSVTLPATAGSYVQLPNIVCDLIYVGNSSGDITLAGSATPGTAFVTVSTSVKGLVSELIAAGGNANNLWMANVTAAAQTIGFMWVKRGPIGSYPAA